METIIGGHYSHQHDLKWPDGHRFSDSWQPRYDEWVGQWGAGKAIALLAYENLPNSRLRAGHVLVDVTETAARRGQDMASFSLLDRPSGAWFMSGKKKVANRPETSDVT